MSYQTPARATHELPSSFVISITPFDESGQVDEAALRRHLGRMGEAGLGVYLIGSGTSEGYSLTAAERRLVMRVAREELKGRVPVRAMGCEQHQVDAMVSYVREAEEAEMDAVHVYSLDIGHGARPTESEMIAYYDAVLSATRLPVVLSSHHAARYLLPISLIERLVETYPHLSGLVCATSDLMYLTDVINRVGGEIEVHCGGPANGLTTLGLGGAGFLSNESNLQPSLAAGVIAGFNANDFGAMRAAYSKLMALYAVNQRYGGSSMRALKPLMAAFGLDGGALRPPRQAIDGETLAKVVEEVNALSVI